MKLATFFGATLVAGHIGLLFGLGACNRPKPPTITPEKGELTAIGADGVHLMLHLAVENPNRFELSARTVTGRVLLEGKYDVGSVAVSQPFRLPAGQVTLLSVPSTLALRDVPVVLGLAASNRDLTYDVDGTVNVGGESLNLDLPFHLSGELTHEQLLRATMNSLPRFP
ncbi:MAG TPA: LEA type 2 family protein [Polyangiaceae bacterium]|nr:LEA type 2 family protein [Polyangiaceae bacterium]